MPPEVRLGEIVAALGGELLGDPELTIGRLAPLHAADKASLSFLAQARLSPQLAASQAACVIVAAAMREQAAVRGAAIVVDDPHLYFARLTQWWAARHRTPQPVGVHGTAVVEVGSRIDASASIGALAFIGADARVGPGVTVGTHCHVGPGASIGAGTRLSPRVTIGEACRIGDRGILHSGVVIGADGFGYAPTEDGRWEKIEQFGAVVIGDDVEIGANTCIDRGALEDTVIEDGVKLDNLIQIGHNVRVGAHSAMAGCVGVAGSARIGRRCTFGGAAMILGHLEIVDDVHVTAGTLISRSIRKAGVYSGAFPFDDNASWEKNAATLRQLHALRERLRALEKRP